MLSCFAEAAQGEVPAILERAADAASCIVTDSPQVAMNRFNGKAGAAKVAPSKKNEKSNDRSNDKGDDT